MKKLILAVLLSAAATLSQAALQPGDHLSPYTIHNCANGKEYCQVCAYGAKPGKVVAFGKLGDAAFWSDLQKLQAIANANPKLGVFAQVTDSTDAKAIAAAAKAHGITFPVVYPVEKDWNSLYDINGASRVVYYAQENNKIVWTATGLDDQKSQELANKVKADLASKQS